MANMLQPENRYQDRYLKEKVATYWRYAEMVRREMDIKQSQVKKRYYKVFVERDPSKRDIRLQPDSRISAAYDASGAPRRRGQRRPLPASTSFSRSRLYAVDDAEDSLRNKVSSFSLYSITAHSREKSRLRAVRTIDLDADDTGDEVCSAAVDYPGLVTSIRRRLAKEATEQRKLVTRNSADRRAKSAWIGQNLLFAEEQCWRKGTDGVIRRTNVQAHQSLKTAGCRPPEAPARATFITELPRLSTVGPGRAGYARPTGAVKRPSLPQQSLRRGQPSLHGPETTVERFRIMMRRGAPAALQRTFE